jgi:hypothetical protein
MDSLKARLMNSSICGETMAATRTPSFIKDEEDLNEKILYNCPNPYFYGTLDIEFLW